MELTASQSDAVSLDRFGHDTCVVAGPGSGKTRVLVEWYLRLVGVRNIPPSRILAITFTEKAANNMKMRIAAAFAHDASLRRELERAYVSTVHGFCARFLRENAIFAGVDPEFGVLDARQASAMQAAAAKETLDRLFAEDPSAARNLMQALSLPDLAHALPKLYESIRLAGESVKDPDRWPVAPGATFGDLQRAIRRVKAEPPGSLSPKKCEYARRVLESADGILCLPETPVSRSHFDALGAFRWDGNQLKGGTPVENQFRAIKNEILEDVTRAMLEQYYAAERLTLLTVLSRFDRAYRERKRAAALLDFDDLEEVTLHLLERNADVRERLRAQFDQVLMDEFQDTNGLQSKLIDLVRAPNVFYAVGDINQSIYGFRYADPGVFRNYRAEVESKGIRIPKLEENWRSRADILRAAQTVLDGAGGIEQRELIASRALPTREEPCVEVIAAVAGETERAQEIEARWIARRILDLEGTLTVGENARAATLRDFAVLARNSEVFGSLTKAFQESRIPYLISRGRGFFEEPEIVNLAHLLRVIANPRDEISLAAVLRSRFVEASDEALLRLKLMNEPSNLGGSLRQLNFMRDRGETPPPFDSEDLARLHRFGAQLERWRGLRESIGFDRLLLTAMDDIGYMWTPGTREGSNIEKLLAIAREAGGRVSLAGFIEELENFRDSDARDFEPPPEDSGNAVRIMTVHAAKGLEFPVVFLAGMHKGVDAKPPALCFTPGIGLGARWELPDRSENKGDRRHALIREHYGKREREESDRLLYVAMTRAEERLVFSFACEDKPKEWAARLAGAFDIEVTAPSGEWETRIIIAPDGAPFPVAVLCANRPPNLRAWRMESEAPAPVIEIARPPADGGYDSNASVTSISVFAHCPRRYYFERYVGWDGSAARTVSAELGLQVHSLLAGQEVDAPHPEAEQLAAAFKTSPLAQRAARASHSGREFDFLMAVEDIVLSGKIDLWFEENGELVLVDYKTDDVDAAEAETRADAYGLQVRLYALALDRTPDKAYVYFLRPNVAVPVELRPLFLHEARQTVRDLREAQAKQEFPLNVGDHCRRCPYFMNLCPARLQVTN